MNREEAVKLVHDRPEPNMKIENKQLIKALIRGLKFTVALLEKVLKGEEV